MGSSSNVSSWSLSIPSVPLAAAYAAPAWLLVALDAFPPVADDTSRPAADVLPPAAADLPQVAPVLNDILPGVTPVLNETPSPADDLPPTAERPVP